MSHYETLGVGKGAGPEEIKKAYRSRASRAHPDKGGSDSEMASVNKAYQVLADPVRREQYDRTGVDIEQSPESMAKTVVAEAFTEMLKRDVQCERVAWCLSYVRSKKGDVDREVAGIKKAIEYLSSKRELIEHGGDGEDVYAGVVNAELAKLRAALGAAEFRCKVATAAVKILESEYRDSAMTGVTAMGLLATRG